MGPLQGVRVIEIAGIGPGPFCAMMLSDMGADVLRIDRADAVGARGEREPRFEALNRGRRSIAVDLKSPDAVRALLRLVEKADVLIEGFRPGVMERLGLGPADCAAVNPRLVYGRMTGWGQEGPLAQAAGHDINYIALTGALHTYGRKGQKPSFPVNAIGDYAGGGMMLAFGVLAAILSARSTGKGQVIDCAMMEGAATISAQTYALLAAGMWVDEREANVLDGGAPYYDTYETRDGKYVAIGSIEPQFHAMLLDALGLTGDPDFADQANRALWPAAKAKLEAAFRTKTRDEWCAIMEDTDICFAPVLSLAEAPLHPHNVARGTFVEANGVLQPAPAPRFSETPAPPVRMTFTTP